MLDFLQISARPARYGFEVIPSFNAIRSKDIIVMNHKFIAIYDEEDGLWKRSIFDAIQIIDREIDKFVVEHPEYASANRLYLRNTDNKMINKFIDYTNKQMGDNYRALDSKIIFADQVTSRKDYATKKLSYSLSDAPCDNFLELVNTLYSPEEAHKIFWVIGCIASGNSIKTQKFMVLYGSHGTGKSTIINIIDLLFGFKETKTAGEEADEEKLQKGYVCVFDAKALGNSSNRFAMEPFKYNSLVAIQHDGDLSKIDDNTRLNSIVSHEVVAMEEKGKPVYPMRINSFIIIGTNSPVKITDSKSGLLRRLIDVSPTGKKVPLKRYNELMKGIEYELGSICKYCIDIYEDNPRYYDYYTPITMMGETNNLYDFMLENLSDFSDKQEITLSPAWLRYKKYCEDGDIMYHLNKLQFKAELKSYFKEYYETGEKLDGTKVNCLYRGLKEEKFVNYIELPKRVEKKADWLQMGPFESIFDIQCGGCYAQYAKDDGTPEMGWDYVETTLMKLDTAELHYVRVPLNHIVIDFDIPDKDGNKSLKMNLEAASKWPKTYAELSKSGQGIHLHYIYEGDPSKLCRIYEDHIEVKVFTGKSSLRRKLTSCNKEEIATISSGLPLRGDDDKTISGKYIFNQKGIRTKILRYLAGDYEKVNSHAQTIKLIKKSLDEAYESGVQYIIEDEMINDIRTYASESKNQKDESLKLVSQMKFKSKHYEEDYIDDKPEPWPDDAPIAFFDVESFPNLFGICYKIRGNDVVIKLVNPTPEQVMELCKYRLIGYNNLKYDNHMLHGAMLGNGPLAQYELNRSVIDNGFGYKESKHYSYTDAYDCCSKKQSLKKWEIELDMDHHELGLPWDQPVPDDLIDEVMDYCADDVRALEAMFEATQGDFIAREILAELAGGTPNDSTNTLTTKLIFGNERHPQSVFNYRDMSKCSDDDTFVEGCDEYTRFNNKGQPVFPGYSFDQYAKTNKSKYRDIDDVGEGGHVWAAPGMYWYAWTFDVASMHPSTIEAEELFGPYTPRFSALKQARIAIKHKDYDKAIDIFKKTFNKDVSKYLQDPTKAKALAQALKIAINSVYGLTAASFEHPFRDPRNIDNIVAKRGALFMINLRHEVERRGGQVIHIKTDSIKILSPTPEMYDFVMSYGKLYGYDFEIEHKFEKICLVNNAVYIAKCAEDDEELPGQWTATGTQFAVPYVFKSLFSHEPIDINDKCELKQVKNAMYLDMNECLSEDEHSYQFIGKVGNFCPIKPGCGGGLLVKANIGDFSKVDAVTGTKGYRWLEASLVKKLGREEDIDISYYQKLVDKAVSELGKYGDVEAFID